MIHNLIFDNWFHYFTWYWGKWDWTIISWISLAPLFEDWGNISISPILWNTSTWHWLVKYLCQRWRKYIAEDLEQFERQVIRSSGVLSFKIVNFRFKFFSGNQDVGNYTIEGSVSMFGRSSRSSLGKPEQKELFNSVAISLSSVTTEPQFFLKGPIPVLEWVILRT